jgi:N-acetylmuramoyl-L-alanine amidase
VQIFEELLPYNSKLGRRVTADLDLVVIHCTELPTLAEARAYAERILYGDGTGNSGHYYIDRDGSVRRYVSDDRVARHVIGHNRSSIGIEIVNAGRYPRWFSSSNQSVSDPYLKTAHPSLLQLLRHSDLDTSEISAEDDPDVKIRRKIDPGPLFPWEEFAAFWRELP